MIESVKGGVKKTTKGIFGFARRKGNSIMNFTKKSILR